MWVRPQWTVHACRGSATIGTVHTWRGSATTDFNPEVYGLFMETC